MNTTTRDSIAHTRPAVAVLILATLAVTACTTPPLRSYDDGLFVSRADPAMRVRIDERFQYLGSDAFMLGTTHEVQRHHWVTTEDGRVTALLQMQFEGIVDGAEGKYEFNVPPPKLIAGSNYRFAPEPVRLGDHDYVHNTWAFDKVAGAQEAPGRESDRTLQLLAAAGYEIDSDLVMARWVRAVGPEQRKEIIFFYIEPLRRYGHDISAFPEGGPRSDEFDAITTTLVARARAAFEILPGS